MTKETTKEITKEMTEEMTEESTKNPLEAGMRLIIFVIILCALNALSAK